MVAFTRWLNALILLTCLSFPAHTISTHPRQQVYAWKNVQIVGGGFVDGIVFHPTAPGLGYARTDMGGAYRWDVGSHRWMPLLDWVSKKDVNLMGVESIAVDPQNPNRVYLACGMYTNQDAPNGAVLRSSDRGKSFDRSDLPFKLGGNEDGRGNGERLAVDPGDGRILYLGTRHDGLWRSQDRGVTWTRVDSFPDVSEADPPTPAPASGKTSEQLGRRMPMRSDGVVFVKFAPRSEPHAPALATQTIYAGVSLMDRPNLFVSHDAGSTWQPVPNEPTAYRPTRAALSSDGFLYVAYGTAPGPSPMTSGAVWKLNTRTGAWVDITPDRPAAGSREFGYAAVSADARHPGTLIASTYGRPGGDDLFRSIDGGASWKPIFAGGGVLDYCLAPYVKATPIHWLFDVEIDPTDSNHAVFTTGYGGWETFDLDAADRGSPTHWSIMAQGIEESVPLDLASPADGAHLVSAIGDYGGFVHWDLDRPAPDGSSEPPRMSNTTGVAAAALRPQVIVRVGIEAGRNSRENIGYSLDGGLTWRPAAASPEAGSRAGSIAVSADGKVWVWTPEHEMPSVTEDRGGTWRAVQGLPAGVRVIADAVNPRLFYAVDLAGNTLYRSVDGGVSFTVQTFLLPRMRGRQDPPGRGDKRGGQDQLYATPGRSGDLWLAAFDGLYRTQLCDAAPSGKEIKFVPLPGVEEIEAFGFGKAAPGRFYPALYLTGTVDGQAGVFRSIDEAHTWVRINDDHHQWGLVLRTTGDPRIFGRVYVGTHGRGIVYGDPAPSPDSHP